MVFPALEPHESYYIEFQGEGQYLFTYFQSNAQGKWDPLFSVLVVLPLGGIGMTREEVKFAVKNPPISVEDAKLVMRAFLVPEDLGTPAGGISLSGATNFRTPPGWDTVYTPIFNMIERPVAPALVVRVETDWFAHESEFRYVLQPGEGFPGAHTMPIGQVFFVPREEVTLADCTAEELEAIRLSKAGIRGAESCSQDHDALRPSVQSALSASEQSAETLDQEQVVWPRFSGVVSGEATRNRQAELRSPKRARRWERESRLSTQRASPPVRSVATIKLPSPAVNVVLLRRTIDDTVWTIPAVPPPATMATDHRTRGASR